MPRIVIGDGALYYERQGVGFPVMLVSGLSGFASFWADLVPSFAKSFDRRHARPSRDRPERPDAQRLYRGPDGRRRDRPDGCARNRAGAYRRALDRRRDRADAGDRAPETRRQHCAVGVLDQAGRLFPAVFRAAQGHPAAPRTQRLCAVQLAVPLSGLVRRPQQRAPASDGGADARRLSADRGRRQPDRRDPRLRPHRAARRGSRRRPSSSAPRTTSSRRPISPRSWRG